MLRAIAAASLVGAAAAASAACDTWYESAVHSTKGFRNVKDFGAVGDGKTDDTKALVAALTQGRNATFTVHDPTVVYLPPGNYLVSDTLPLYFYTHLIGNFACPPTITVAAGSFETGGYVVDADEGDNSQHYTQYYRAIYNVNFVNAAGATPGAIIRWSVSQAAAIRNVAVAAGKAYYGILMEDGSGGFIGDVTVTGGTIGISTGNEQWVWRNVSVSGSSTTCVQVSWDFNMVFWGLNAANCPLGLAFTGANAGQVVLVDSTFYGHEQAIDTAYPGTVAQIYLERVTATNTDIVLPGVTGNPAGTVKINAWRQGAAFKNGREASGNQGNLPLTRADAPLPSRSRPTFGGASGTGPIANVFDFGALGNGLHDDTAAIQAAIDFADANAPGTVVFLPQGNYIVSSTITLRRTTVLVGEVQSALVASSSAAAFTNPDAPTPLLVAPAGTAPQLADLLFTSNGDVGGCVFLDWQATGAEAGAWDVHWRLYNQAAQMLRVSGAGSTGYFESAWAWAAPADIDTGAPLSPYVPVAVSVEGSTGGFTCVACGAEHAANYQFLVTGAANVTLVLPQAEAPYWQTPPTSTALAVVASSNVRVYGTGLYNLLTKTDADFFNVTACPDIQLFGANVQGTGGVVLVGDQTISDSTSSGIDMWQSAGFAASVHV